MTLQTSVHRGERGAVRQDSVWSEKMDQAALGSSRHYDVRGAQTRVHVRDGRCGFRLDKDAQCLREFGLGNCNGAREQAYKICHEFRQIQDWRPIDS